MDTQTRKRVLTSDGVATTLGKALIAPSGASILELSGRGNEFTRESNGTKVVIFNVLAFATMDAAKTAQAHWQKGSALEAAKDIDGAQEHFRNALNEMMSFSVLEENAPDFRGVYEVACVVEQVQAGAESQKAGIKTVLGINKPRPIAIKRTGSSAAALFSKAPATNGAGETKTNGQSPALRDRRKKKETVK